MWKKTSLFQQAVILATLGAAGLQSPILAEGQTEVCVRRAMADCAEAMEGTNFLERIAVGAFCSLLIGACYVDGIAGNLAKQME